MNNTFYRDLLCQQYDKEIGSNVGCGLDRLDRKCTNKEIQKAIDYFKANKDTLLKLPISTRREMIAQYVNGEFASDD